MAPRDWSDFSKRMEEMTERLNNTMSRNADSLENRMDNLRRRMEKLAETDPLDIDFPSVSKRSAVKIKKGGKETIIVNGKVVKDDIIDFEDNLKTIKLIVRVTIPVVVFLVIFVIMSSLFSLFKSTTNKPKQLNPTPPAVEQPVNQNRPIEKKL